MTLTQKSAESKQIITSVPQKNVPSAVVIDCAWYVFLRDRRYLPKNGRIISAIEAKAEFRKDFVSFLDLV